MKKVLLFSFLLISSCDKKGNKEEEKTNCKSIQMCNDVDCLNMLECETDKAFCYFYNNQTVVALSCVSKEKPIMIIRDRDAEIQEYSPAPQGQ